VSSKDEIREKVWSRLQEQKVARFPGAEGRIPNFIGAEACARVISQIQFWKKAKVLKVNPDSPQRAIRQKALEEGKIIYMDVPRLHSDKPFIELDPKRLKCSAYVASSIKGAAKFGRPVNLEEVRKIDLIVCGSVAVNRKGARVGKGGGYSDLEFALAAELGAVDARTTVVTTVHDLQVVRGAIPMTAHDVPVDVVVTPTRVLRAPRARRRPRGIRWEDLDAAQLAAMPAVAAHRRREA